MPLSGGPADKLGNRYENWWTVYQLVRMLQGSCESIRIEDPGIDKAEFVLAFGGVRERHQAKRSHRTGRWTLATLASPEVKILQAIGELLHGNTDRFVFVSASHARELAELVERARQAATAEEFETVFVAAQDQAERFARLQKEWKNCDLGTAYERLQRIEVRTADEQTIKDLARLGVAVVYLGNPDSVVAELRTIAEDSVHDTITREDLIATLDKRGFKMRRAVHPDSALAMVEATTRRYLRSVRGKLIRHTLVSRSQTQALLDILGERARDVVLTGVAGGGKTGCVIEFIDELQSRGVPVLALRLDQIDPVSTGEELGRRIGLDESPALVLAAAEREAVLVIDQLDAISTASGRSAGFFDAIEDILSETRGLREREHPRRRGVPRIRLGE
jgi:rRNA-processing protein FCF1